MQKLLPYNKSLGEVRRKEIREPLEDELSYIYFCLAIFAEGDLGADGLTTMEQDALVNKVAFDELGLRSTTFI